MNSAENYRTTLAVREALQALHTALCDARQPEAAALVLEHLNRAWQAHAEAQQEHHQDAFEAIARARAGRSDFAAAYEQQRLSIQHQQRAA